MLDCVYRFISEAQRAIEWIVLFHLFEETSSDGQKRISNELVVS